jgi:hypothetical protein
MVDGNVINIGVSKISYSIFGVLLHDCIVEVWSAVSARVIVGLFFFQRKNKFLPLLYV